MNRFPLQLFSSVPLIGLLVVMLGLFSFSGCDQSGSPGLQFASVQVTVQVDDEPLGEARVLLMPLDFRDPVGDPLPLAQGETDEHGTCLLVTPDGTTDIMVTKYRVIVLKPNDDESKDAFIRRRPGRAQGKLGAPRFGMFQDGDDAVAQSYNRFSDQVIELKPLGGHCEVDLKLQSALR